MKASPAWLSLLAAGVVAVVPLGCEPRALATTPYLRATTFCIPWDIVTTTATTAEVLREGTPTIVRDRDDIAALVHALNPGALRPPLAGMGVKGDFRLVVDLIRPDGSTDSFAADRGRLVRLVDGASHAIHEGFRKRFPCPS